MGINQYSDMTEEEFEQLMASGVVISPHRLEKQK